MVVLYGSKYFQDVIYSVIGDNLQNFFQYMMMLSVFILSFVLIIMYRVCTSVWKYRYFKHSELLEWVWTVIPMITLFVLWFPSTMNLYDMNHGGEPKWSFKAIGHQWYWSYEFLSEDKKQLSIDSYMDVSAVEKGGYRLLDVDQRMVVPALTQIRLLVSSVDVLHSFAMPALMLKVDAIPGRMNQLPFTVSRTGVFYGQCSEICGVNHSFMPIVLEFIRKEEFDQWLVKVCDQQWS
uniref:Cytochrome c oxidase subunit 2 n=1 Tax=Brachidontes exustus TaxID=40254 RepID=A0A0U1X9Z9_BRAEX|nr:cytochrome c oxidase subunit II [Brachidontes exustus]AIM58704.1 cytochrome c oxidase subunit II [Brachidontes exustus]